MESITTIQKAGKAVYVKQMPLDSNGRVVTNAVSVNDLIKILINAGVLKPEDIRL